MQQIRISAPARLHLGFLDLHGGLGRNFGSLGLTLDRLKTIVSVRRSDSLTAEGPSAERAKQFAHDLMKHLGQQYNVHIHIEKAIPSHIGLGSGTQLLLSIGYALSQLFDLKLDIQAIAEIAERGARSGIGIGAFEKGGFLIDSGKGSGDKPPSISLRAAFPDAWRVLLIFDEKIQGLHGEKEIEAFRALPRFSEAQAGEICRLTLMQLIPGLTDVNLDLFGRAIGRVQQIIGDYFSPAQGGRFISPAVTEVLYWIEQHGISGIGQSSWGPTGFAILPSENEAQKLLESLRFQHGERSALRFEIVKGLNTGAEVEYL